MTLRVEGNSCDAAVWDGRQKLTGATRRPLAELQLEKLERQRRSTQRPCLCCRKPMISQGPGHRMCGPCRSASKRALI